MIGRITSFAALAALIFSFALLANAATDPGVACAVAKHKAAVKKLSEKMKCHDNALKKGEAVDPACLTKAEGKFDDSFAKAEAKGGCVSTDDAPTIEATIDDMLVELLQALPSATSTTTTSTSTTTTNPVPPTCAEDGDDGACVAFEAFVPSCITCCNSDTLCNSTCISAAFTNACDDLPSNAACAVAANAAGCADECCP